MNEVMKEKLMNDLSIEVISKSIIKEAREIGFQRGDYIKLANLILDSAIKEETGTNNGAINLEKIYDLTTKYKLPLKGEHVKVRPFNKKKDSKILIRWLDDEVGRYFILTRATSRVYDVERLIEKENHILGIITLHDDTPIGLLAFLDYDSEQNKAELRKLIGEPDFRGRGYGKEATQLWIQYGLTNLKLNKIYLNTLQTNVRNIRLNEELGFRVEGILRNECLIDGTHNDVLRMGLFNNQSD